MKKKRRHIIQFFKYLQTEIRIEEGEGEIRIGEGEGGHTYPLDIFLYAAKKKW